MEELELHHFLSLFRAITESEEVLGCRGLFEYGEPRTAKKIYLFLDFPEKNTIECVSTLPFFL